DRNAQDSPPGIIAAIGHGASLIRSTCRHDRRAGAFELGKFAAPRHLRLQLAAVAADDRTVGIRLIEGVQQAPPPSASSAAGLDIAATLAAGRHPARLSKWIGIR